MAAQTAQRALCPHCNQPLVAERCGVRLPLVKAMIFDAIKAAGDPGITTIELASQVYDTPHGANSVRSHISQINDMLEATDWRIRAERSGINSTYHLIRQRKQAA